MPAWVKGLWAGFGAFIPRDLEKVDVEQVNSDVDSSTEDAGTTNDLYLFPEHFGFLAAIPFFEFANESSWRCYWCRFPSQKQEQGELCTNLMQTQSIPWWILQLLLEVKFLLKLLMAIFVAVRSLAERYGLGTLCSDPQITDSTWTDLDHGIDWSLFDEIAGDNDSMTFPFAFPDAQDEYVGVSMGQQYPVADETFVMQPEQNPVPTQSLTIAMRNTPSPSPSPATVPTEGSVSKEPSPSENFVCDRQGCEDEKFTKRHQWKKHMDKHTRPFTCSFESCPRTFSRQSDLKRHEDSVHKRTGKFFCSVSGCECSIIGFPRKDHLEQHARPHGNGERPMSAATEEGNGESSAASQPTRKWVRTEEQSQPLLLPRTRPNQSAAVEGSDRGQTQQLEERIRELENENKRPREKVDEHAETIHSLVKKLK